MRPNTDRDILYRYKSIHDPPVVDVTARVAETIDARLLQHHRTTRRAMAACATVSAVAGGSLALAAWLLPTQATVSPSIVDELLIAYQPVDKVAMWPASTRKPPVFSGAALPAPHP